MAKRKKHTNTNAQLVGDTRLTLRQFKKFSAAYHNVQRDNEARMLANAANPAFQSDLINPASLGNVE